MLSCRRFEEEHNVVSPLLLYLLFLRLRSCQRERHQLINMMTLAINNRYLYTYTYT